MPTRIKDAVRRANDRFEAAILGALARNWRVAKPQDLERHAELVKERLDLGHTAEYWETEGGKADLRGMVVERLESDRRTYVPWINSFLPLRGSNILEIGSGTGASTVALAEQGAMVTGVDIQDGAMAIAEDKFRIFGVDADLRLANFLDYAPRPGQRFDAVVFFASLEHMLIEERLQALPRAWDLVRPGGHLVVAEAPNRLWHFDHHTSQLPFFNWLPDELALRYFQFSPRSELVPLLAPPSPATLERLWRWGLGASFHEFDLSLGRDVRNAVGSSLGPFLRRRSPLRRVAWHALGKARFARFLNRAEPGAPRAWFEPFLDLALRKP